jgi:nicotinamidase-related amidase
MAKTVLELMHSEWEPARLPDCALVLVCMQMEFRDGPLQLSNVDAAVDEARALLERFRSAGAPVIHVARSGGIGEFFDRAGSNGRFIAELMPRSDELVLETSTPNPFVSTKLEPVLRSKGTLDVVFAGFSSHSSLSSAVRYAAEHGFRPTVVASACATRDLPAPGGIILPAQVIHLAAMASLADRHACVVEHASQIRPVRRPILTG